MFNSKDKSQPAGPQALNLIGAGTSISGDVSSSGDLRLDGNLIGTLQSKSKVVLGPNAMLEGNLIAQNADVAGKIIGTVEVNDTLVLKASAVIEGDIIARKLVIEAGARFNGNCTMNHGENVKLISDPTSAGDKLPKREKVLAAQS